MLKSKKILLASHGTEGARAAEKLALTLCPRGGTLFHLVVVPDFWKGMMGDDWLNNASTRDIFGRYVESRLGKEADDHIAKLEKQASKNGIRYRPEVVLGKPTDCLLTHLRRNKVDLVILGSPRPRGRPGLRSRMLTEALLRALPVPVVVAPHPYG